jgi:hypothetical protein
VGADSGAPTVVSSIEIRPENVYLDQGQTLTLTVFLRDAEGGTVTDRDLIWGSSDSSVAVVSGGRVTALRDGETIITAFVDGSTGSARVAVRKPLAELFITPADPVVAQNTFVQLEGELRGPRSEILDDRVVTWTSSDPRIVAVSVGKARGVRIGSAQIVATAEGKTATTSVTVVPNVTGPWNLIFEVADAARSAVCRGVGRLAFVQSGPVVGGTVFLTTTCEAGGALQEDTGELELQEGTVSAGGLSFIQTGGLRCSYSAPFVVFPLTNVAGGISCIGAIGGLMPGTSLIGEWRMTR